MKALAGDLISVEKVEGELTWKSKTPLPFAVAPNKEFYADRLRAIIRSHLK